VSQSLPTPSPVVPARDSRWVLPAFVSFALALAILLPRVDVGPLGGTEAHRALSAHQMLQSGDWLIPQLYGRLYMRKPPLQYWITAGLEKLAGHGNEFIWRLPSVLSTALLAAVVAWASGRWFGRLAAWVGGLSLGCMVTLWAQGRTGELDSLDALLTVWAVFIMIDLAHGTRGGGRWPATIWCGLLIGGAFLTKGPVCMILVGGLMIWTALTRNRPAYAARPGTWKRWIIALLIGLVMFGIYAAAAAHALAARHVPPDMTGVNEIMENAYPTSLGRAAFALVLPLVVLLYALPFSVALPVAMMHAPRDASDGGEEPSRAIIYALAMPILISFLFGMVTGMHLPRYQFIALPLLCPLAGATAEMVRRFSATEKKQMGLTLAATAVGYFIGTIVLALVYRTDPQQINHALLAACVAAAVVLGVPAAWMLIKQRWGAAIIIPILALILSVPFATYLAKDRRERSGFRGASLLREDLPPGATVTVGGMLGYEPELFYYSGVGARAYAEKIPPPDQLPGNQWLVLDEEEFRQYKQQVPQRMGRVIRFEPEPEPGAAKRAPGFIVWLTPATR